MIVLAGDVGGTNARLALVDLDGAGARVIHQSTYSSQAYDALAPIVRDFLSHTGVRPERACVGVPGPVIDGRARTTNLAWTLDAGELRAGTGIPAIRIINDFVAVGHGIAFLGPDDVATLQHGEPGEGQQALVGAGTGLGVGFRISGRARSRVFASEGGHAPFSPRDEREWQLARWLRRQYGEASWERVVSGPGLINIYRFLLETGSSAESAAVRDEMAATDPAAVISRHGLDVSDPVCAAALDLFVSCYGAVAGLYGVVGVAHGGVFLSGGIAPRILPRLRSDLFLNSFLGEGVHAELAARLPVHVIVRPDVGVLGAALAALDAA